MTTKRNKGGRPPGTATGRETAREAYYAEMAEKARLSNAKARGELIDAEAEYRRDFAIARTIRDRILSLPARLGPELAGLGGNQTAIEIRLEEGLREALEALADELQAAADVDAQP